MTDTQGVVVRKKDLSGVATGSLATAVSVDGGALRDGPLRCGAGRWRRGARAVASAGDGCDSVFCVGATPGWHDSPGAEGRVEKSLSKTDVSKLVVRLRKAEEDQFFYLFILKVTYLGCNYTLSSASGDGPVLVRCGPTTGKRGAAAKSKSRKLVARARRGYWRGRGGGGVISLSQSGCSSWRVYLDFWSSCDGEAVARVPIKGTRLVTFLGESFPLLRAPGPGCRLCRRAPARALLRLRAFDVYWYSTMTLANVSSIDGNTAKVSPPALALASGLVVGLPRYQPTLDRCERPTSR